MSITISKCIDKNQSLQIEMNYLKLIQDTLGIELKESKLRDYQPDSYKLKDPAFTGQPVRLSLIYRDRRARHWRLVRY